MKFRKKPVVVEALQWTGFNLAESETFMGERPGEGFYTRTWSAPLGDPLYSAATKFILTEEGMMSVFPGSWIVQGVQGEFYPCRDDIFRATYEAVEDYA